jgi:hypothetical protein
MARARTDPLSPAPGVHPRTPFVDLLFEGNTIPLLDGPAVTSSSTPLFLRDFSYLQTNQLGVGGKVQMRFLDPGWDFLSEILSGASRAQKRTRFSFRYGWRGIDDAVPLGELQMTLLAAEVAPVPYKGAEVTIRGVDGGYQLSTRILSGGFPPNLAISGVLKQVIESVPDLEADVTSIKTPVGEESNRIENSTAIAYIRSLLSISRGARGESSFAWVVLPGSTPGKTLIRILPDNLSTSPVRRYLYGRESQGEMLDFSVTMDAQRILLLGGNRVSGIVVDPRTKTIRRITSTQDEDLKDAEKRPLPTVVEDTRLFELPRSEEHAENRVRSERADVDQAVWTADAEIWGDTGIHPMDRIEVVVLKTDPQGRGEPINETSIHEFSSGIYRVRTVEHTISAGTFRTRLSLFRNAGAVGAGEEGIPLSITPVSAAAFRPDSPVRRAVPVTVPEE